MLQVVADPEVEELFSEYPLGANTNTFCILLRCLLRFKVKVALSLGLTSLLRVLSVAVSFKRLWTWPSKRRLRPDRSMLAGMSGVSRLCLWGADLLTVPLMWDWIENTMDSSLLRGILKIERVFQATGKVRFDLYVKTGCKNHVCSWFKSQGKFACRDHLQKVDRPNKSARVTAGKGTSIGDSSFALRCCTWNIRGLKNKRLDVEHFLQVEGIDVISIQETLKSNPNWKTFLRGFNVVESLVDRNVEGARGIALAVRRKLIAHTVYNSPHILVVRIYGKNPTNGVLVAGVYIPSCSSRAKRNGFAELWRVLQSMEKKWPNIPMMVLGDLNTSRDCLKLQADFSLVKVRGSPITWFTKGWKRYSAIDHALVNTVARKQGSIQAQVNRNWDVSDHWPLVVEWKLETRVQVCRNQSCKGNAPCRRGIVGSKLKTCKQEVISHNYWQVLADLEDRGEMDSKALATEFIETSYKVAACVKALRTTNSGKPNSAKRHTYRIFHSKKTLKAVKLRRIKFCTWRDVALKSGLDLRRNQTLRLEYENAKRAAKAACREDMKLSWLAKISEACKWAAKNGDKSRYWRWLKRVMFNGNCNRSHCPGPIVDPDSKTLISDPNEIAKVWASHYGKLAADPTGHSRSRDWWSRFEMNDLSELDVNGPILWSEIRSIIAKFVNGKAPGIDGIPPEWFKGCLSHVDEEKPTSPMARVLHKLVERIWVEQQIPDLWRVAKVISIPKSGDRTLVDNYRGISLIAVGLKVLCAILARRISSQLEISSRFPCCQAANRTREEAVAQATALYEILMRRKNAGLLTYVCFIDFRKAFDTVPHGAMLYKLSKIGVRGRALDFISMLYQSPKIVVEGPDETFTAELLRGVRQGCPLSPLLFSVFINDILNGMENLGVQVPGIQESCPGLLFADDLVSLSDDSVKMQEMLNKLSEWGTIWEMDFGIAKCGMMVCNAPKQIRMNAVFQLHGMQVPVVESYVYLGVNFTHDLKTSQMVRHRLSIAHRKMSEMRHFLSCTAYPFTSRLLVVKSVLIPSLLYGSEIWGMKKADVAICQTFVNEALRLVVGIRGRCTLMSVGAAQMELDVPSMHALTSARRARLYYKAPTMRTWIARLCHNPWKHRCKTWVSGTATWIKRFGKDYPVVQDREMDHSIYDRILRSTWLKDLDLDRTKSKGYYCNALMTKSNQWSKLVAMAPSLIKGAGYLLRARLRALWTGRQLSIANILPKEYCDKCTCCGCVQQFGETLTHLLIECPKWDTIRERFLNQPIAQARKCWEEERSVRGLQDNLSETAYLRYLLLGGEIGGHSLEGWDGIPKDHENGPLSWKDYTCLKVCAFFQEVMPLRHCLIGALHQSTTSDEDPNG
jgi:exonuclease III